MNLYCGTIVGRINGDVKKVVSCYRLAKTEEKAKASIAKDYKDLDELSICIDLIDPEVIRAWYEKVVIEPIGEGLDVS